MKRVVSRTLAVLIFLMLFFVPVIGFCQIGDPGGDPGVPISGIEWLLAAGGILGAKKLYAKFKKS